MEEVILEERIRWSYKLLPCYYHCSSILPSKEMTSNRRPSRSISDVTKFDCQCGHYDCEVILNRKAAALSRRKESLLPSLNEERGQSQKNNAKSPLPALFRKLSLVPDDEENAQAKRFGKVKKIFFSPHPDDVAYSCFGLASGKRVNSTFPTSSSRQSSDSSNAYSSAGSFATNSTLESNDEIGGNWLSRYDSARRRSLLEKLSIFTANKVWTQCTL